MRIYIAAPWIHREVAASWSFALEVEGHSISYKWWEHEGKGWEEDDEDMEEVMDVHTWMQRRARTNAAGDVVAYDKNGRKQR